MFTDITFEAQEPARPSLKRVRFVPEGLRQCNQVTCGPAVAIVASALLDPIYRANLADADWFAAEQSRVHAAANRIWPRALGTTPPAMTASINGHGAGYGWRIWRRGDALADVEHAVRAEQPVAMLIGTVIPRHWVLIVDWRADCLDCYEASSGEVRPVFAAAVSRGRVDVLGFPRVFAFVLPRLRRSAHPRDQSNI